MPATLLRVGDRIRVGPGQRVPADAEVTSGQSEADESLKEGMRADIEEMDRTISQFLDFARAASSENETPDADINKLITDMASRYERAGKQLTVKTSPVPALPLRLLAMQRLIGNLIDNALRHGGYEVTVGTGCDGSTVFIEVLDRGPGIPPFWLEAGRRSAPGTRAPAH